jgi:hypothetical protein
MKWFLFLDQKLMTERRELFFKKKHHFSEIVWEKRPEKTERD